MPLTVCQYARFYGNVTSTAAGTKLAVSGMSWDYPEHTENRLFVV
jgi:hypothetical protein